MSNAVIIIITFIPSQLASGLKQELNERVLMTPFCSKSAVMVQALLDVFSLVMSKCSSIS